MMTKKDIHQTISDTLTCEVKKGVPAFLKRGFSWDEERKHVDTIDDEAILFMLGRSYYYRGGSTPEKLETYALKTLAKKLDGVKAIESGDNWAPFKGNAKSMASNDSFIWVVLAVPPQVAK